MIWSPRRPGLAVGVGQAFIGTGNILCTQVFNSFIVNLGVYRGLVLTSLMLTAISMFSTLFLRYPKPGETPTNPAQPRGESDRDVDPAIQTSEQTPRKLRWACIFRQRDFWLYIFAVFTAGVSYCFNPYFYKLGLLFDRPMSELIRIYQAADLTSTVGSLVASVLSDYVRHGDGYWFSGTRNIMAVLMFAQIFMFGLMPVFTKTRSFLGYVGVKSALKVLMACHESFAALLAHDFFGETNMGIVFGLGAGFALGSGEGISVWAMSAVEALARRGKAGLPLSIVDYNPFFVIATLWAFLGFVAIVLLARPAAMFGRAEGTAQRYGACA